MEKLYFCRKLSRCKIEFMMFTEQIKQLREERQISKRKLATALDIDTATCCKIENI
jgi:DNA-binding XRE family transcriptional regulator